MNTDMKMLIASTVLLAFNFLPYLFAFITNWGWTVAAGNRDKVPDLPPWAQRARRAHANLVENFPHFAVLVIAVQLLDVANPMTALGATIFFYARLAYWVIYTLGIVWVRTIVFLIGLFVGEGVILWQLLTAQPA